MSIFDNIKSDDSIEGEEDRLGGAALLDSGAYPAKVNLAWVTESSGGAMCINVNFNVDGREVRQRFYATSGRAKGQKNYYETKDGEKRYLPGYNIANALCLLTVGKELQAMDHEKKVIKLYDPQAKAEVPTEVPVLTDLIGQEIILGVLRQTVDKVAKNDAGAYQPTGETREENEVDKLFRHRDSLTSAEIRAGVDEPKFLESWKAKWTGEIRDKSTGGAGTTKASAAGKTGTGGSGKPTESLFG
jgi:hypothetical protein